MGDLFIRGGTVVDPAQGTHAPADVLIRGGVVEAVGTGLSAPAGVELLDASGTIVAPGFIDVHTHLREPGGESSETIESGTRAAVTGGFTTVYCMPNTSPVCDSPIVVKYILDRAREAGLARVLPAAAVTRGQQSEELTDFSALLGAGAGAMSDDGRPVASADMMRRALQHARELGAVIFDHCEDMSLTGDGVMHEGVVSVRLGLKGIPRLSEASIVMRDGLLALETGGRLHICHVSNTESIEAIRWLKQRGAPVTAEVTPHHLTLTDEAVAAGSAGRGAYDTHAKMKPPLCAEEDRQALIAALEDGTIDCIATDHAPHSPASKDTTFDAAPFGIIGMETAFCVLHTAFVAPGRWTIGFLVEKLTAAPARVMGLQQGSLRAGAPGDVTVLDPAARFTLAERHLGSRSRNCPWLGWEMAGRVIATVVGGRVVHHAAVERRDG